MTSRKEQLEAIKISVLIADVDDLPFVMFAMSDPLASTKTTASERQVLAKIMGGDIVLARVGNEDAGIIRIDRIWPESVAFVTWAFVLDKFRGVGVYEAMSDYSRSMLRSEGYHHVLHSACDKRASMSDRFRSQGMKECGHLYFPDGMKESFFWEFI